VLRGAVSAVIACLIILILNSPPGAGMIEIKRPDADARWKAANQARLEKWLNAPIKDVPSKRKILKSTQGKFPRTLAGAVHDTLRVATIRVEFANVPDYSQITGGTGRFDLRDLRGEIPIDPPPHDARYFSKHMEALDYYYNTMSYGHLTIESQVFPLDNDSAYVLDDVGDYNPEGGQWTWRLEGLELFFRDAIMAADQDEDLRFSDFDAVVICHAGSDWQNDIMGDSPYDIPSFFITLAETAAIAVDDSTVFIVDGSVVPETTSQDGFYNGINGVVAHEMGHQLGLPDLYDTYTGLSAVGYWCVMDFGSGVGVVLEDTTTNEAYYVSGIIPGSLCAWSKAQLGWAEPTTVKNQGRYWLRATELQEGFPSTEMLKVPMNSHEFYLVENRQNDLDGDGTGYLLTDPSEDSTGVIIGPVNADREFNHEFDFALPGAGILIWHVDQLMVDFGNPYDIVNAYWERRGVSLVEADGIPDLGDLNSFYFLGSPYDPFFEGNNDRLAFETYPRSTSTTGCHSHITIRNIGVPDIVMGMRVAHQWGSRDFPVALGDSLRWGVPSILFADIDRDDKDEVQALLTRAAWVDSTESIDWRRAEIHGYETDLLGGLITMAGWPRRLHGSHPTELVAANMDDSPDGSLETFVADETGRVYAFKANGSALYDDADSLGAFYEVKGEINGVPTAGHFAASSFTGEALVFVGTDSALYVFDYPEEVYLYPAGPELEGYSQPIVADVWDGGSEDEPEIVYYRRGSNGGRIEIIGREIEEKIAVIPVETGLGPGEVYLAAADLDRDAEEDLEIILIGRDGWVWAFEPGGDPVAGWGRKMLSGVVSPPAFADIDRDGYTEMILNDADSRSVALLHTGSIMPGWPNSWHGCSLPEWDEEYFPPDSTIALPPPIIGDFSDNDTIDVIQGSLFECITGWGPDGERLDGFPVTLGERSQGFPASYGGGCSALAFGDIDGDGIVEIMAGGGDGFLYGFSHLDAEATDFDLVPWKAAYHDATRNMVFPAGSIIHDPPTGEDLLVAGSFHAYPNPAGGDDPATGSKTVHFVFETGTGGLATIDVYDITGARVRTIEYDATSLATRVTVPPVDISGLGSGLYICKLSLRASGRDMTETFKLAIRR
jgi:M6 family metalloprotease-like protein